MAAVRPTPIERLAAGEDHAMHDIVSAHGRLIGALARRATPTARDAEDAYQEILLEIWRAAPRFDPDVASEKTFVSMITRRRLIDINRRRRPPYPGAVDGAAMPAPDPTAPERLDRVRRAYGALSQTQQTALRMALQGMTHGQIAGALDMPIGTVKSHVRRAMLCLREHVDHEEERRDV